ncbi:MAG TPA: alpha-2-macroglobulin family protein, partial [Planctomycetota bacterium]|nr:alpha-2-macroglobulin family protein [Planctomycetota bacterium]
AGALGEADAVVEVRKAFYIEPKLPLEVTAGDVIDVPVAMVNGTAQPLQVAFSASVGSGLALATKSGDHGGALAADGRGRDYVEIEARPWNGKVDVRFTADAGGARDEVRRTIPVVPLGFPMEVAAGGRLAPGGSVTQRVVIPESVEPTSIRADAVVYPTPLASLQEALARLLQEPCGCFEQTSSTSYPNVMVMQYLKTHPGADGAVVARAADLLDRGYKRLTGFECKTKGYEWFGTDPGHEALTAYGLLQFTDMASVYPVDAAMLERTRGWLLERRDGKGGFTHIQRALHTWAGPDVSDMYITWALLEAGIRENLEKEVAHAREMAAASSDPYVIALGANILLDARDGASDTLLAKLVPFQKEDGRIGGATTSVVCSGGEALDIETTSLAVLAWLRTPAHTAHVEKAMTWLTGVCKGGSFGSTQSTVLALRAVLAYDAAHATPKAPGTLVLSIDGAVIDEVPFTTASQGAIRFPAFAEALKPGAHAVELRMVGGSDMPYSLSVKYSALTPPSSDRCKVRLATALGKAEVREGETVDLSVELANATDQALPMAVAIVGLPAGLEARPERLKELVRSGQVDAYETRGRELVFYKTSMAAKERVKLALDLVAAVPGRYTGPASRAYLYYTAEDVAWVSGLGVRVARP